MGLTRRPWPTRRRRRRAFSLNGLAIQLSAFALSFTLVALLVVSGSHSAFVETNEIVAEHVPTGLPAQDGGTRTRTPSYRTPVVPPQGTAPATEEVAPPATEPASPSTDPPSAVPTPAPADPAVELDDDDAGTAMFGSGTVLSPGVPLDRCITVTFTGDTDPDAVVLYAAEVSGGLARYLDLVVDIGPTGAGGAGGCAGFTAAGTVYSGTLAGFAADHARYASGLRTWDPAGDGDARRFRFHLSLRDDPAAEGAAAGFGFTWETRAG